MFKLGKLPIVEDKRDLMFWNYFKKKKLPTIPASFGHENLIKSWGMLGNDRAGNCVWAGAAHETMLWNQEVGSLIAFTDKNVLSDYSTVTGYNPSDPSSDQGTVTRDSYKYRHNIGIIDSKGVRHKIGAYLALEPGNTDHLLTALYLFGAVGIGINFPESAMEQFNAGKPWAVVPGAQLEGGHYVPLVAYRGSLYCVTWGKLQPMTLDFYKKYCDEAWLLLSPEMMKNGKTPEGFDLVALQADMQALRK